METQLALVLGAFISFIMMVLARADFVLIIKFINYTNPTGLCAECETQLDQVNSADQLVPVCCNGKCNNTREARCDTRFRWNIRQFNASLETRPPTVPNAVDPPYFFTDCSLSDMCPFSEKSITFDQGPGGIFGVEDNPLQINSTLRDFLIWTGEIQFFIEPVESKIPSIIDSVLVNLETLQLGADFTEERTYSGYHNISHMTLSFRVECSIGFCGHDCTVVATAPRVQSCLTNGKVLCVQGYDPLEKYNNCLLGRNVSTNCTTCLSGYVEIMQNSSCVPNVCFLTATVTTPTVNPTTMVFSHTTLVSQRVVATPTVNPTTMVFSHTTLLSQRVVGGITGGVVGVIVLLALVVTVTLCILNYKKRINRMEEEKVEAIEMTSNPVYKELDRQHPQIATGETTECNTLYENIQQTNGADQTTYYENIWNLELQN